METLQGNEIIFAITKADLQHEAKERIRKELTDEEILIAKKALESGIGTSIGIIYNTIFSEMIEERIL